MAKKTGPESGAYTTSQKPAAPQRESKPAAVDLTIKLRRNARCGALNLVQGTKIAEVRLEPGVDLNYMVDALRGGLASEVDFDLG